MLSESSSRSGRRYSESERAEYLARQELSGLSVAEFCRRENIGVASFHSWKKRARSASFTEIVAHDSALRGSAEIVLATGDIIRIGVGCDPEWLGRVVMTLRSLPC
jgi:transposase-like protein